MVKSFLKWAGGKSKLLPKIYAQFPSSINRYIEPFLGSAVVLLNVSASVKIGGDANPHLINVFHQVKTKPTELITLVKELFLNGNNSEKYYQHREQFNSDIDDLHQAALFIYLNRHCFNGLCRYNSSGKFNVPFGKYKTIMLPEEEIQSMSNLLSDVELHNSSMNVLIEMAQQGDVVYCDPPYLPATDTAYFSYYTADGFSYTEHVELVQLAQQATKRGATVIISNHDTAVTQQLYHGHVVDSFEVRRTISATNRNKVKELIALYKPTNS